MAGRFDEAIEHFRAALRMNPGSRETAANLERARAMAQGGR
jgi:tetratricopeptide (TPR) repeat protein